MKRLITFFIVLFCAKLVIGFTFFNSKKGIKEETVEYTHKLLPNATLEINNNNGTILVEGWDKDTIHVKAIKKATEGKFDNLTIDAKLTDNLAQITTHDKENDSRSTTNSFSFSLFSFNFTSNSMSSTVDYTVQVPKQTNLKVIKTKNGSITIKEVESAADIYTGNGSIKATTIKKDLLANVGNGSIKCSDIGGSAKVDTGNGTVTVKNVAQLAAQTGNGDIKIFDCAGPLNAQTGRGNLTATNIKGPTSIDVSNGNITMDKVSGPLSIKTNRGSVTVNKIDGPTCVKNSNGDIMFTQTVPADRIELKTARGNIELHVAKETKALLSAQTVTGTIQFKVPQSPIFYLRQDTHAIEASMGAPSIQEPKISLQTTTGSIKIIT